MHSEVCSITDFFLSLQLRNTIDMEAREVEKLQVMIDHLQTLSVQVAKQAEEYEIEACQ